MTSWDNSIAESFFHTLKVELVHNYSYQTRQQAKLSIFQYKECILLLTIKRHLSLNAQDKFQRVVSTKSR